MATAKCSLPHFPSDCRSNELWCVAGAWSGAGAAVEKRRVERDGGPQSKHAGSDCLYLGEEHLQRGRFSPMLSTDL